MRRIREVLRLHAEKRSLGEIAVSLNIGKSTVREYVERGRAAGLSWPLPSELDDAALEARLYPGSTEVAKRVEPDWLQVRRELSSRRHHVTLSLLWLEYRQAHPDGYGYTQFCVKFRRWQQAQDLVMRFEYPDAERVFIDFCGDTMDVIDPGPARSSRPRSSAQCSAPAATCTPKRSAVKTSKAGSQHTYACSASMLGCPRSW